MGSGSRSMDDDSTSTEESLMGRSSSSPTLNSMELNHVATQQQHRPLIQPDYSAVGHSQQLELAGAPGTSQQLQAREVVYFPASAAQPLRQQLIPEEMTTPSSTSNFIPELALYPTPATTHLDEPDASFHRSPLDCSMLTSSSASGSSYQTRRKQFEFEADPSRQAQARWFGLRPDSAHGDAIPQLLLPSEPANRFSPSLEEPAAHINHGEEVSAPFLHGTTGEGSSSLAAFAVPIDIATDGHLVAVSAPFQHAAQAQGSRSLNDLDGPGLSASASSDDVGSGPHHLHPLLLPVTIANAGPFSSTSAHFPSSNTITGMITSFATSSGPLQEATGSPASGLRRLPEYAPRPSPRVALWDFRQDFH